MKKIFLLLCILYITVSLVNIQGCSWDPPTSSPITDPVIDPPNGTGGFSPRIIIGGGGYENRVIDSTTIFPVKKNIPLFVNAKGSPEDSIIDAWVCFGPIDCVNELIPYRSFSHVGDTLVITIKVWRTNGDTANSYFRIYIVDFHGPGGSGDIEKKSVIITNSGYIVYDISCPTSRIYGPLDKPGYFGPITGWVNKPITRTATGVFIISDTAFDGKICQFNYMGNTDSNNWSSSTGSLYDIGSYYAPILFKGLIYPILSAPGHILEGVGDSTFRVFSRNDSVILVFHNIWIPDMKRRLSTVPYFQTKIGTGSWTNKPAQKLDGSSGWGRGGIKFTSLDTSTYIIQIRYGQASQQATMNQCFAWDQTSGSIVIAFIPGNNRPGGKDRICVYKTLGPGQNREQVISSIPKGIEVIFRD